MKNFEDILRVLNPAGPWQIATIVQSFLVQLFIAMPLYQANYFLPGTMKYTCTQFGPTQTSSKNADNVDDQCFSPATGAKCVAWNYSSPYYASTFVNEWNLVCDDNYLIPMYKSAFLIGFLIGVPMWGGVSDWIGRWPVFALATPLQVIAFLVTLVAEHYEVAAAMRLLQGFAYAGTYKAIFVLNVEICLPSTRNIVAVLYGVASPLAGIVVSLFGLLVERHWRIAHLYAAGLSTLTIPLVLFLNESPRWLIINGKYARAENVLKRAAKWNRRQLPLDIRQYMQTLHDQHEHHANIAVDSEQKANPPGIISVQSTPSTVPSFTALLRAPEMRKRTLVLLVSWLVVGTVFYGASFYSTGQMDANPFVTVLVMSIARVALAPLLVLFINSLGKKLVLALCLWFAGVSLVTLSILVYCKATSWVLISFAVCSVVFISGAFETLYIFTGELYPTVLRQTGLALSSMAARIGAAFSPFIADLFAKWWQPAPAIIFAVACFLATGMLFLLPEMNNKVLPETVKDTEKDSDENATSGIGAKTSCFDGIELDFRVDRSPAISRRKS